MADPELSILLLMALAAFGAGWVDAVVGGGGLIQLPALLLGFPGATPAQLLATNKFGSIFGTADQLDDLRARGCAPTCGPPCPWPGSPSWEQSAGR